MPVPKSGDNRAAIAQIEIDVRSRHTVAFFSRQSTFNGIHAFALLFGDEDGIRLMDLVDLQLAAFGICS
ncbi:hypothetical protein SDC9_136956 [bioreactor metagenome]|uniref:Uncharacterized protein n=1 Tax=bioreactor metagenome TaxID=1076179 RepID=A0A645DKR2_9ZZZZ